MNWLKKLFPPKTPGPTVGELQAQVAALTLQAAQGEKMENNFKEQLDAAVREADNLDDLVDDILRLINNRRKK